MQSTSLLLSFAFLSLYYILCWGESRHQLVAALVDSRLTGQTPVGRFLNLPSLLVRPARSPLGEEALEIFVELFSVFVDHFPCEELIQHPRTSSGYE